MKEITTERVNQFVERIGDYIEPFNLDLLLGLSQITNSIEQGYKLYKENIFNGYSLCFGTDIEDIKKDILYRAKTNLPIKFTYEVDKEKFVETVSSLEGEELDYYLQMNGYKALPTGISICMQSTCLQ